MTREHENRLPRYLVDVFDSNGNRQGKGPIHTVQSVRVHKALDEIGRFSFDFPIADTDAVALVTTGNTVDIIADVPPRWRGLPPGTRVIGSGVIDNIRKTVSAGRQMVTVSGKSNLIELSYKTVLLGRTYANQTISAIASDLISLVSGWSVSVDSSITATVSARFDVVSVWAAFVRLAEQQGLHLRADEANRILHIGAFGGFNGLELFGPLPYTRDSVEHVKDRIIISDITLVDENSDTVNWLMPLGGGEGDSVITLADSTRSSPYTIQTIALPDGRTGHYISTGTADRQKTLKFQDIVQISNSTTNRETVANALYDAASEWLTRNSVALQTYKIKGVHPDRNLQVGDVIRVNYKHTPELGGSSVIDLNTSLWILDLTENWNQSGSTIDLTVSTIDRKNRNDTRILVQTIENLEVRGVLAQPFFNKSGFVYRRELDDSNDADVPVFISLATQRLEKATLRLRTRPFRATATGAASGGGQVITSASGGGESVTSAAGGGESVTSASGGGESVTSSATTLERLKLFDQNGTGSHHLNVRYYSAPRNSVGTNVDTISVATQNNTSGDIYSAGLIGSHQHNVTTTNHTHSVTTTNHTHSVTTTNHTHNVTIAAHTHDLVYGIQDDTETPDTVRIALNSVDKTSTLGGPWFVGGGAGQVEIDITDIINAEGTFHQEHTLSVSCDSGQGEVEAIIELYEIIQQTAAVA